MSDQSSDTKVKNNSSSSNNSSVNGNMEIPPINTSSFRKLRKNICNQCKVGNHASCSANVQTRKIIAGDYAANDTRPVCVCLCYGVEPAAIKDGKSSYNRSLRDGTRRRAVNDLRNGSERERHPHHSLGKVTKRKSKRRSKR